MGRRFPSVFLSVCPSVSFSLSFYRPICLEHGPKIEGNIEDTQPSTRFNPATSQQAPTNFGTQAQIQNDFNKVTHFGKKAGYLPPPKIPAV